MGLHRRQLPIASPCERFEGSEATADRAAFCTRCDKHVHDLSRMTEPEVVNLFARNHGHEICVSYRVRADGAVALRKPTPRLGPAAMALSLAGCAGHLAEAEASDADCVDAAGYHVECPPTSRLGNAVIPDAVGAVGAVDPAQLEGQDDVEAEAIDLSELDEIGIGETIMRGGVGSILLEPLRLEPLQRPPLQRHPGVALESIDRAMGAMVVEYNGRLGRRVKREVRRLERRERREARAPARR
jgi:hypothetical protein